MTNNPSISLLFDPYHLPALNVSMLSKISATSRSFNLLSSRGKPTCVSMCLPILWLSPFVFFILRYFYCLKRSIAGCERVSNLTFVWLLVEFGYSVIRLSRFVGWSVTGSWLLVTGCWLLVPGSWLLAGTKFWLARRVRQWLRLGALWRWTRVGRVPSIIGVEINKNIRQDSIIMFDVRCSMFNVKTS